MDMFKVIYSMIKESRSKGEDDKEVMPIKTIIKIYERLIKVVGKQNKNVCFNID
jgi:hypothetical protein